MLIHVKDLPASIGKQSEKSEWREVDQAMINQFATMTGDDQWIHVDPERCIREGMEGTIIHGFLILSLIGGRFLECIQFDGVSRTINAGLDKVRFLQPVSAGTALRVGVEVAEVSERAASCRAVYRVTVEARGLEGPVAIADLVLLHHVTEN